LFRIQYSTLYRLAWNGKPRKTYFTGIEKKHLPGSDEEHMIEKIKEWDTQLFLLLNSFHTPLMDTVMYWITDRWFWFPFYGLIIFFLIRRFKWQGVWIIVTVIIAITLADQIASAVFKPYFLRKRPCYEEAITQLVHVVRGCGGQYGFVSSHASTTFAFAMLMWLLLRNTLPYISYLFYWAFLVSYSRIYVGVHYPLDLFFGALVGIGCALLMYSLYKLLKIEQRRVKE
jgi:undecaprenyl-diphosphatase